jgi:hypothetical protein
MNWYRPGPGEDPSESLRGRLRGFRVLDLMVLVAALAFSLSVGAQLSRKTVRAVTFVMANITRDHETDAIEALTSPRVMERAAELLKAADGANDPTVAPVPTPEELRRSITVRHRVGVMFTVSSDTGDPDDDLRRVRAVSTAFYQTGGVRGSGVPPMPPWLNGPVRFEEEQPQPFGSATQLVATFAMAAPIVAVVAVLFAAKLRTEGPFVPRPPGPPGPGTETGSTDR